MIRTLFLALLIAAPLAAQAPAAASPAAAIIALEKAALDRWGKGDVNGYLEIMDPGVTYFDPTQERRIDGLAAMKAMLEPFMGKIRIHRYEMVDPKVQVNGDTAVLTFRIVNYALRPDGKETVSNRWNTTEVYRRTNGGWRIWHSHFSFTRPVLAGSPAAQ